MVTKNSKLYPAVKICQSMIDYYRPFYLDHITQSEYDFIQLYELKKLTPDESYRYHSYIISFSSHDASCIRLRNFFYDEKALKVDYASLLYLSIMDSLFDSYFDSFSYSITDIYYYVNLDFIYFGFPFFYCLPTTFGNRLSFELKDSVSPLSQK